MKIEFKNQKTQRIYTIALIVAGLVGAGATKFFHHRYEKEQDRLHINQKTAQAWDSWRRLHCTMVEPPDGFTYKCDNGIHYTPNPKVAECVFSLAACEGLENVTPTVPTL